MKKISYLHRMIVTGAALSSLCLTAVPLHAEGTNIFPEGDFESGNVKKNCPEGLNPTGGGQVGGTSTNWRKWVEEDGNKFIRVFADPAMEMRQVDWSLRQPIPVGSDWTEVTFKVKVRTKDFEKGDAGWHDARIVVTWQDASGEKVKDDAVALAKGEESTWKEVEKTLAIAPGATQLTFSIGTWGAKGTMDFDDLQIIPVK
jgi:hypothetical protein